MAEDCCSTQLVNGDGVFNSEGLDHFLNTTSFSQCDISYVVVAIMGPQSSGKSTLMNNLFGTSFREMDALKERNQITKGIWIAKCAGVEPFTIAMDLEGTDGKERGQDDTTFEKQSSLFALAVADIVLIKMWCHDIGREQVANRPLLKTVFQVMITMQLLRPRKTTLMFVIRDKTKSPLELLESLLRKDIQEIWDAIVKPQEQKDTPLDEYFNVEVTALSSYEEKEDQFKEQVSQLRQDIFRSVSPGGPAGDRCGVIPASGFSFSVQQMWKTIKDNKNLDLPALKVMVSSFRCEEIKTEKLNRFVDDEKWISLKENVDNGTVTAGFGEKLNSILGRYLSQYDKEASYFDDGVRDAKRNQFEAAALNLAHPAYVTILWRLHTKAFRDFKNTLEVSVNEGEGFAVCVFKCSQNCLLEFNKGCTDAAARQANWDASKVRKKLEFDMETYSSSLRSKKFTEQIGKLKKQLTEALNAPIDSFFETCGENTWASIRKLLRRETNVVVSELSKVADSFLFDRDTFKNMARSLREHGRILVKKKSREEARKVLLRIKDRFSKVFNRDDEGNFRVWTKKQDIKKIAKDALSEPLKILSIMAALRLVGKSDNIKRVLFSSLEDETVDSPFSPDTSTSTDPLASNTWEEILPENTLISPIECKWIWRLFIREAKDLVDQAEAQAKAPTKLECLYAFGSGAATAGATMLFGMKVGSGAATAILFGMKVLKRS